MPPVTIMLRSVFGRWLLCLMLVAAGKGMAAKHPPADTIIQEIRFVTKGADKVILVWGLNNWQLKDTARCPQGTFIKDGRLHTPMTKAGSGFSVKLAVPARTIIDYMFLITKGPGSETIEVWDRNAPFGAYHTMAIHHNIALVESSVVLQAEMTPGVMDYALPILLTTLLLLGVFIFFQRKYSGSLLPSPDPVMVVIASGVILYLFLMAIRPSVVGADLQVSGGPVFSLGRLLALSFHDFLFVLALSLMFLLPVIFLKNYRRLRLLFLGTFLLICVASLVAGMVNVRMVELLGKPFNYQWMYYAAYLRSAGTKAEMPLDLPPSYPGGIMMVGISAMFITVMLASILSRLMQRPWPRRWLAASLIVSCGAFLFLGARSLPALAFDKGRLANPVTAFLQSVNPFTYHPALFTMEVQDSLRFEPPVKAPLTLVKKPGNKIKNVIVFVLESTPAEYIQPYGSSYQVTPQLARYASKAVVFENIYAHAPATDQSMVSLLGSAYPWLSGNSPTAEHPHMNVRTISSELRQYGYRAGFFNSADNRYQRAGEFLAANDFEAITDCRGLGCGKKPFAIGTGNTLMNGRNDACTAEDLMAWIKSDAGKPFFAMIWTCQTRYPYVVDRKEKNYHTGNPTLNRYLNALWHSDDVFGRMMTQLKQEKLLESTLVVVTGDHGEAFGRHGQVNHSSMVYEENLHVPCMFIHPSFKKSRNAAVGGLVDVSPTIMDLLGLQSPADWQGQSLLAERRSNRAYFFSPYSEFLFGYREGSQKYIYNASRNVTEIYDLTDDPHEEENLAGYLPAEIELCHQRMAAWTQYVNGLMRMRLADKPKKQLASSR